MTRDERSRVPTPEQIFGELLRQVRKSQQLSQDRLVQILAASGLELTQTQISRTEEGKRPLHVNEMITLMEILDMSPADVVEAMVHRGNDPQYLQAIYREQNARGAMRAAQLALEQAEQQWADIEQVIPDLRAEYEAAERAWSEARKVCSDCYESNRGRNK